MEHVALGYSKCFSSSGFRCESFFFFRTTEKRKKLKNITSEQREEEKGDTYKKGRKK